MTDHQSHSGLQDSSSDFRDSSSLPQNATGDAGYIDLVNVTETYSGAIETAAQRLDRASSDAALAIALAEKAELERQLKVRKKRWQTMYVCILGCHCIQRLLLQCLAT